MVYVFCLFPGQVKHIGEECRKELKGVYSKGDPPLPIPNREVKPFHADGTAVTGGRVGRRRIFRKRVTIYSDSFLVYLVNDFNLEPFNLDLN